MTYPQNVKVEGDDVKLLGNVGKLYCCQHREFEGKIKSATVSLNPDGRYYVSLLVEDGREQPPPSPEGEAIGIDLGLTHFAITSDGSKFDHPRHLAKHARNLKRKQKKLSRKKQGSNNRDKARQRVARVHSKIARCREDFRVYRTWYANVTCYTKSEICSYF